MNWPFSAWVSTLLVLCVGVVAALVGALVALGYVLMVGGF